MSAPPPPSDADYTEIIHYLWEGALTLLGGFFMRRWNRLEDRVDNKAEKEEVQVLRDEIGDWKREQQEQHRENRQRLDRIWEKLNE